MTLAQVRNRMVDLGFHGMLPKVEAVIDRIQKGELNMTEALDLLLENEWSYLKFRERLVRPDILILDDLGMRKFSSQEAEDLRDIIELRSYGKSTIITTQLPTDHWSEVIGDEIIRDALIDRLVPTGLTIELKGPTYRDQLNKKTVAKKGVKE